MDLPEIRSQVRAIIFGITGIIIAFIFFRIGLQIFQADQANFFINLIYSISDFFISPFYGTVSLPSDSSFQNINADGIIAIGVYVLGAIALSEIITAFIYDKAEDIVQNVVDALFKIIEFLLFLRIIFDLLGLISRTNLPQFVNTIYSLTEWAQGIILPIKLGDVQLNISTTIVLVIIIIMDIFCERFLASIFRSFSTGITKVGGSTQNIHITFPRFPSFRRDKDKPSE